MGLFGNKDIFSIDYSDIVQLINNEMDEGYFIDYKRELNINKELCKDICSFANSDGGWLFFGIDEDKENHNFKIVNVILKKSIDYSQQISQFLKTYCSPIPKFFTRFLTNKKLKTKGVYIIYIPKGVDTPYVSNGKIYVRNGSSSEPILVKDRHILDNLILQKANNKQKYIDFCKRQLFDKNIKVPIINIFIQNLNSTVLDIYNDERIVNWLSNLYGSSRRTINSLLFLSSDFINNSIVNSLELFEDLSLKLTFPIPLLKETLFNEIKHNFPEELKYFNCLNGMYTWSFVLLTLSEIFQIYKSNNINIDDLKISIMIENILNKFLVFQEPPYKDTNGKKTYFKSNYDKTPLIEVIAKNFDDCNKTLIKKILYCFGYGDKDIKYLLNTCWRDKKEAYKRFF